MFDALLLSGGKGTRSENPAVPKSLQQLTPSLRVVDTIASSLGPSGPERVIAVLGHFYNEQEKAYSEISWPGELVVTSSLGLGTSHAVVTGLKFAKSEWVAVVAADSALSFDFVAMLDFARRKQSDVVFAARFSDHPEDSDSLVLGPEGLVVDFRPKSQSATGAFVSVSGVVLFRRAAIDDLPPVGDFQANLFHTIRRKGLRAHAWISRFYCRDTGTPARLEKARKSFQSGDAQFRGRRGIGAIFIDRDGTLIPNTGDDRKRVEVGDLQAETIEAFLNANECGVPIFIVTNQPGVAKGKISIDNVERSIADIQLELSRIGAVFDDYRYCTHHPERGWLGEVLELKVVCDCRKPRGGMGRDLAEHHLINTRKSWVIGDSDADRGFATELSAKFIQVSHDEPMSVADAIRTAVREIRHAG